MRDARAKAREEDLLGPMELDGTSVRIDNDWSTSPDSLKGCLVRNPHDRPSDIVRKASREQASMKERNRYFRAFKRIEDNLK